MIRSTMQVELPKRLLKLYSMAVSAILEANTRQKLSVVVENSEYLDTRRFIWIYRQVNVSYLYRR